MRKRLYRNARVEKRGETYLIVLDGKPATTRRGAPLAAPTWTLALAVAEEWNRQGERLDPADMMLTSLAVSAIDRAGAHRCDVIEHVLGFGGTDLVCYRAADRVLAARQSASWDSLLDWVWESHGVRLVADAGITFIGQPPDALLRMREIVSGLDDFTLAALDAATAVAGSFVLALALIEGRLDVEAAFAAAHVDELYQAEKWGHDAEAESRRKRALVELAAAERFVSLLSNPHHVVLPDVHPRESGDQGDPGLG